MRIVQTSIVILSIAAAAASLAVMSADGADAPRHVIVWREAGRYGGWPANHGIWSWGDEILVGFSGGYMKPDAISAGGPARHPIDRTRPEQHLLARSTDGGESWKVEHPEGLVPPPTTGHMAGVPIESGGRSLQPFGGSANLDDRDFIMTFRMGRADDGPSWFFTSPDRGHTWRGPFAFPRLGNGVAARTDYLVTGRQTALVFLTSAKSDGNEGRVFTARTADGGRSFTLASWVGAEPSKGFNIMPSTVRLDRETLVMATRRQTPDGNGIDIYRSADLGRSWAFVTTAVSDTGRGNPPSMIRLRDGRLVLTYGYRAKPFGIHATISTDEGRTWGTPRVLRDDAQDWDLGYPRTVQRGDGRIVTVYYFNDARGPERYIAATIWDATP